MELVDKSINQIRILSSRQVTLMKNVNLKELIWPILSSLVENTKIVFGSQPALPSCVVGGGFQ